ncbi:MAG: hypothetical protein ACOC93_04970, partial [Planctomycetota bacterium]
SEPNSATETEFVVAILVGIDEAGVGPVVGPLVCSATAWRVPGALAGRSMWGILAGTVCRKPSKKRSSLAIGDSKQLYRGSPNYGLEHIERGVLTALAALGVQPANLRELLEALRGGGNGQADGLAWYPVETLALPRAISPMTVTLSRNALSSGMKRAGVELLGMWSEPVLAGEFNRLIEATDNKASTCLSITARLLARVAPLLGQERVIVHVDRQGGRMRYLEQLKLLFEGADFKIISETPACSAYRVIDRGREAEFHFVVEADDRQLPVALASMLSKYVRELHMELLNGYWTRRVPGLAPTAGYSADGRRFCRDIGPHLEQLDVDPRQVIRLR